MVWRGIHRHDRMDVSCCILNVQSYMDIVIQPEVVPYVQGDGLTFQKDNAFSFSICLTQDLPRSNAVCTLPWTAYPLPCTPSSIGAGHRRSLDKVTWPISANLMPGNLGDLGWHPTGTKLLIWSYSCHGDAEKWIRCMVCHNRWPCCT